jgi:hypothetical protein
MHVMRSRNERQVAIPTHLRDERGIDRGDQVPGALATVWVSKRTFFVRSRTQTDATGVKSLIDDAV